MAADQFTVYAHDLVPNTRIDEVPFTSFEVTETLDRPGSFRGTLPTFHDAATDDILLPMATSLYVDHGGLLRWGFIQLEDDIARDEGGEWTTFGEGHFAYLLSGASGPRRTIDSRQGMTYAISTSAVNGTAVEVTFPNASQGTPVDMFDVVADLIAHAANIAGAANVGFDGIRMSGPGAATAHPSATGTLSGVTWARTYWSSDQKGIGEAILEIAQSYPGFDWKVNTSWDASTSPPTARRYLDLYYPRVGQSRAGAVLEHGGNVWMMHGNRSGAGYAHQLRGIGAGDGAGVLTSVQQDPSVLYPAGRYPYVVGRFDANEEAIQGNLDDRTYAHLAVTRQPVWTFTVRVVSDATAGIRLGDVNVGDTVRFIVDPPETEFMIDGWYRIVQQHIEVADTGLTNWELSLVDDAVSTSTF